MVDLSTKVLPELMGLGFRQKNIVVSVEQSEGDDAQK